MPPSNKYRTRITKNLINAVAFNLINMIIHVYFHLNEHVLDRKGSELVSWDAKSETGFRHESGRSTYRHGSFGLQSKIGLSLNRKGIRIFKHKICI